MRCGAHARIGADGSIAVLGRARRKNSGYRFAQPGQRPVLTQAPSHSVATSTKSPTFRSAVRVSSGPVNSFRIYPPFVAHTLRKAPLCSAHTSTGLQPLSSHRCTTAGRLARAADEKALSRTNSGGMRRYDPRTSIFEHGPPGPHDSRRTYSQREVADT
jgi:hypothetical protein